MSNRSSRANSLLGHAFPNTILFLPSQGVHDERSNFGSRCELTYRFVPSTRWRSICRCVAWVTFSSGCFFMVASSVPAQDKETSASADFSKEDTDPSKEGWVELFDGKNHRGLDASRRCSKLCCGRRNDRGQTPLLVNQTRFCAPTKHIRTSNFSWNFASINSKINSGGADSKQLATRLQSGRVHGYQVEIDASPELGLAESTTKAVVDGWSIWKNCPRPDKHSGLLSGIA